MNVEARNDNLTAQAKLEVLTHSVNVEAPHHSHLYRVVDLAYMGSVMVFEALVRVLKVMPKHGMSSVKIELMHGLPMCC